MNTRATPWHRGERLARQYLSRRGYKTLATNLHIGGGEADLVMLAPDRHTIVLVEVKSRTGEPSPGRSPEAAITRHKQTKLLGIASALARRKAYVGRPIRIDVVAVELPDRSPPIIRHHENAVRRERALR